MTSAFEDALERARADRDRDEALDRVRAREAAERQVAADQAAQRDAARLEAATKQFLTRVRVLGVRPQRYSAMVQQHSIFGKPKGMTYKKRPGWCVRQPVSEYSGSTPGIYVFDDGTISDGSIRAGIEVARDVDALIALLARFVADHEST